MTLPISLNRTWKKSDQSDHPWCFFRSDLPRPALHPEDQWTEDPEKSLSPSKPVSKRPLPLKGFLLTKICDHGSLKVGQGAGEKVFFNKIRNLLDPEAIFSADQQDGQRLSAKGLIRCL